MNNTTLVQSTKSNIAVFLLSGFLQGLTCWLGSEYWPHGSQWQASLMLASILAIVVFCFILQFSVNERRLHGNIMAALATACLFGVLARWYILQVPDTAPHPNSWKGVVTVSSTLGGILLLYFLLPFIQSWPDREDGHWRYTDLFRHSWDNLFILLVATLLTGAYWLLIVLWVMLFKMVGITLFENLFFSAPFAWLTLPVAFSLGIRIGLTHDRIISSLRQIVLSLCGWLMPLLAVITLLFGASLPFTGLKPIWDTGYSTPILLCLLGANIVLLNGIFQDGSKPLNAPGLLVRLTEAATLLLPVFALIGVYSTWLRISQYGLSPKRIYLVLLLVVACSYSFAYALAVIRRTKTWMAAIRPANIAIALFICLCIVLIHSPLINPVALSSRHQLHRLLTGQTKPEEFDFGALKFQFGIPGENALTRLHKLRPDSPLFKKIADQLAIVDKADSYYSWKNLQRKKRHSASPKFTLLAKPGISLKDFGKALEQEQCQTKTCLLYPVDLNGDKQLEILLIDTNHYFRQMLLFARDDNGTWEKQGVLGDEFPQKEQEKIEQLLKSRMAIPVPPPYQSLKIGETVYQFSSDKLTERAE